MLSLNFLVLLVVIPLVPAVEFVHIRSGPYGQLITSSTLYWTKTSEAKDPVTVPSSSSLSGFAAICHISNGPRDLGLVEEDECKVVSHDGREQRSSSYQLLSGHAAKTKWVYWQRPKSPLVGSVALFQNQNRFIAFDPNNGSVGYFEQSKTNIGTCAFPAGNQANCLVLTEIEPTNYELTEVELKGWKGFRREAVPLASTTLSYIPSEDRSHEVTRTETVLTFKTNQLDNWGTGNYMAKGLPTVVKLAGKSSTELYLEWGLPHMKSDVVLTQSVWADLHPGTGVNVTIRGFHLKGDMTYWATLKTSYKNEPPMIRHIEGHRKVDTIEGIHVEKSRPFYLSDGTLVMETTTLTTTPAQVTEAPEQQDSITSGQNLTEEKTETEHTLTLKDAEPSLAIRSTGDGMLMSSLQAILFTMAIYLW